MTRIMDISRKIGLDLTRLKKDMSSSKMDEILNNNRVLAQKFGISGTPAFIIGNQIIPGAIDFKSLKHLISRTRKNSGK